MSAAAGGGGMQNWKAIAAAEKAKEEIIRKGVEYTLKNGNVFYASTHGEYDDLKTARVPPNTLLFIALADNPGYTCKSGLDYFIWPILQPSMRDIMFSIMYGIELTEEQQQRLVKLHTTRESYANALMQFGLYVPGDPYLDRTLQIGGDPHPEEIEQEFGPEPTMGFYDFGTYNPNIFYPELPYQKYAGKTPAILHDLRDRLNTEDGVCRISDVIAALPSAGKPRIVFMSSCASVNPEIASLPPSGDVLVQEKISIRMVRAAEGGLAHRNRLTYLPELVAASPGLKELRSSQDPHFVGMVDPHSYTGYTTFAVPQNVMPGTDGEPNITGKEYVDDEEAMGEKGGRQSGSGRARRRRRTHRKKNRRPTRKAKHRRNR